MNIVFMGTPEFGATILSELVKEHNAKLNKTIEYTYDNGGNLLTKTEYEYKTTNVIKTTTYTYDSTWKDLLVSYDGKAITTDAIGNVLTYDGKTYPMPVANDKIYFYTLEKIKAN